MHGDTLEEGSGKFLNLQAQVSGKAESAPNVQSEFLNLQARISHYLSKFVTTYAKEDSW
jgi:hypothetical protein